jgi:hypothetical protein
VDKNRDLAGDPAEEKQDQPIPNAPVTILKDSSIFPSDWPDFFDDAGLIFGQADIPIV